MVKCCWNIKDYDSSCVYTRKFITWKIMDILMPLNSLSVIYLLVTVCKPIFFSILLFHKKWYWYWCIKLLELHLPWKNQWCCIIFPYWYWGHIGPQKGYVWPKSKLLSQCTIVFLTPGFKIMEELTLVRSNSVRFILISWQVILKI